MYDVFKVRQDFPALAQEVNDEPLIYLDNAATTQKPKQVIAKIDEYYQFDNANVHRGVHTLAERATRQYEEARAKVQHLLNAQSTKEIIFTRGATTSLNWIARGFGEKFLQAGDEIILSLMEHHANIVPWQQLAQKVGAKLRYVAITSDGYLDLQDLTTKINDKTKIIALAHVSNVLGTENPIAEITKLAHKHGAVMVVDGAQAVPHMPVDVQALDCDFYVFSGHKMCAPTGIGVLYAKEEHLQAMDPVEFGGEMIDFVYQDKSTWTELPWKFEAGTPNIAGGIALGAAIDYLNQLGFTKIHQHEQELVDYVLPKLLAIDGITVYGPHRPADHTGVISFNLADVHPHDLATALDMEGIAIRAGHHCAQPLMRHYDVPSMARASFYLYNTKEEADRFVDTLIKVREYFKDGFI